MASLVKYAGSRDTGSPKPPSSRRRLELSAETVGGHAQKEGVLEDHGRLIKTHELCTLKTTGFEHAYRRLRMRVVATSANVRRDGMGYPEPARFAP
jgi:hypothetical protein